MHLRLHEALIGEGLSNCALHVHDVLPLVNLSVASDVVQYFLSAHFVFVPFQHVKRRVLPLQSFQKVFIFLHDGLVVSETLAVV